MNKHKECEISQLQQRLDTCHQELVHHRAQAHTKTNKSDPGTNLAAKLKTAEHELKLVRSSSSSLSSNSSSGGGGRSSIKFYYCYTDEGNDYDDDNK